MPDYQTKSIPHEVARGEYFELVCSITGKKKHVRKDVNIDQFRLEKGLGTEWKVKR